MSASDFVHLHVHSDYSLIDGAAKTDALAEQAKRAGHVALALTDHGSVSGIIDHWKACEKVGVKGLIGCEAYLAPGLDELAHTRRGTDADGSARVNEKGKKKSFDYSHFTLIAKNGVGWKNLQKLASIASLEGFYYRPRMSWALLTKYREGLIALSGCLSGQLADEIKKGDEAAAEQHARRWLSLFGDDYYMEMMPAGEIPEQAVVNDRCLAIAKRLGIKPVATGDVHYVDPSQADVQEVKICVNAYKTLAENRASGLCMPATFYYKSTEEMYREFSQLPEAVRNTREIADKCQVQKTDVIPKKFFLPKFVPPTGESPQDYFRRLSREGLIRRFGVPTEEQTKRLEYELECISKMGFVDYFLVVHDFIDWARKNGVSVGPGRGSAAGSLVSFCLGITNIDPLRYDLLFERFLNPDRVSMPDIDIDFCERNRWRVIEYVRRKYGAEAVAQIITFGESKAKSAVKDVARVLEVSPQDANRLTKMIPDGPKAPPLSVSLETIPELAAAYNKDPKIKNLFDLAVGYEGLFRNAGRHAAGIVIGDTNLIERIPLTRVGKGEDAGVCTAFSMEQVEEVGLLKMDFLGLRTLTQIEDTLELIEETTGRKFPVDEMTGVPLIPVRDAKNMAETAGDHRCWIHEVPFKTCRCCDKALEVLCAAETNGVFQVESAGMKKLLKQMKPDRFDDLIALVALFRPGPLGSGMDQTYVRRKNGEEELTYEHPRLEPITNTTYGVFCYQEQLMQLSVALAGFTLPQADELRKATAKKKADAMAKIKDKFIPGCINHGGMLEEQATALWEKIVYFSEYSFNKCLAGSTEVIDAETGEVSTIEAMFKSKREMRVHSLGDDLKLRHRRVTDVVSNGRKEVYELLTLQGKRITATGTHRFRAADGWRRLSEIKAGDLLATPRRLSIAGDVTWPEHEIVVLAGLLTEGNLCHPNTLYFTAKDSRAYVDDFMNAAAKFERTEVRLSVDPNGTFRVRMNTGRKAEHGYVPGLAGVRCGAFEWADRLGLLGHKATTKRVPPAVFRLRDEQLAIFIGRLWSGDGFVSGDGNRTPFYATSSPTLACHVQTLLIRLGVVSGIHFKTFMYRGESRPGYTVHVVGSESITSFMERIAPHIVGRERQVEDLKAYLSDKATDRTSKDTVPARQARALVAAAKARSKRGFRRTTVGGLAEFFDSDELRDLSESDVFWDEVVSVTPVGVEETYDLTVETDHNFVANGIVVHNSHSAAYGFIGWHTAWLKANFPVEFMAALMTSWSGSTDDLARYVEEARRWGVPVEPPDINEGMAKFRVRVHPGGLKSIVYGLEALKGISGDTVRAIVEARRRVGRFRSFLHFSETVDPKIVTAGITETLAKAGAFHSTGAKRSQLLEEVDRTISGKKSSKVVVENAITTAVRLGKEAQKDKARGQTLLFSQELSDEEEERVVGELLPAIDEWKPQKILAAEKESLGLYLSGHPLDEYAEILREFVSALSVRSGVHHWGEQVVMGGVVRSLRRTLDRSNNEMAFATVEDIAGTIDAVFFGSSWQENQSRIAAGRVLFFVGKLDRDRDPPSLRVKEVVPLEEAGRRLQGSRGLKIEFYKERIKKEQAERIKEILNGNPGSYPAFYQTVSIQSGKGPLEKRWPTTVDGSPLIRQEIANVLQDAGSVRTIKY